jgi:SAM-dependent methyltransferase
MNGDTVAASGTPMGKRGLFASNTVLLFLASFLALYFELVIIRYLSSEIRVFAYLKNLSLVASFFGIGLGMILGKAPEKLKRFFPLLASGLFLVIAFASTLHLTHVAFPDSGYWMFGDLPHMPGGRWTLLWAILAVVEYLILVPAVLFVVIGFFTVLGGIVGQYISKAEALSGYGINLAGSFAGILAFMLISWLGSPPAVWVLIGFLAAIPFFMDDWKSLAAFAVIVIAIALPRTPAYWSPYYRIAVQELAKPAGWNRPSAFYVDVNHDYHQKMLDLSPEFARKFPDVEPNRSGLPTYDLPYRLAPNPGRVLVVGAGTGNDVAAALRHGAAHVDAVEIDPMILQLGRKYHPERPYDSERVSVHVDDARAFFKKSNFKYDLIVFGYLDSHTLLTSLSSVRLDNYVYTLESFQEARTLLTPNGTLVLAFSSGHTFVGDRLYASLARAFDAPPLAFFTAYDATGVVFVEGAAPGAASVKDFPEIGAEFQSHESHTLLATDHWPFLYLQSRSVPVSILVVLILFLYIAFSVLQKNISIGSMANSQDLHLFFLGAGFLLLETKGVTELSLLFGSTWVVNAVVIAAFMCMALLANTLISFRPISRRVAYAILFALLIADVFLPYSLLGGLPGAQKILAAGALVGLPVFFSGLVFSRSFREVRNPAHALGVNLLGAVVGGVLENSVMIGGTPILSALAIALYGVSAVFVLFPSESFGWNRLRGQVPASADLPAAHPNIN